MTNIQKSFVDKHSRPLSNSAPFLAGNNILKKTVFEHLMNFRMSGNVSCIKRLQRKVRIRRMQSRNAEHPEHPVSLASATYNSQRSKCHLMTGINTFQHKHHPNLN